MSYTAPPAPTGMTFMDVMTKPNGRIAAKEYWMGIGGIIGGNIISNFIPFFGFLLSIFLIYSGCCVYGKRLHDAGRSAWLHAIPWALGTVITIVAVIFSIPLFIEFFQQMEQLDASKEPEFSDFSTMLTMFIPLLIASALSSLMWLGYTIWVGVLQSDPSTNQYGHPPNSDAAPQAF